MDQLVDLLGNAALQRYLFAWRIECPNCWMSLSSIRNWFLQYIRRDDCSCVPPNCADAVWKGMQMINKLCHRNSSMDIYLYGRSFETHETTIAAGPRYPSILMVGNVRFSGVLFAPGIEPADRPSHSYRNRKPFCAGCSTMTTHAPRGPLPLPFAPLGFICPGFCGWVFCVICADVAACGIWLLFWFWSTAIIGGDTIESNGGRCTSASPNTGSALAIASTARREYFKETKSNDYNW